MADAENLDARLDFDHAFFAGRQGNAARKEKTGQSLPVPAAQESTGGKSLRSSLRTCH
jgi:hypothetical protein